MTHLYKAEKHAQELIDHKIDLKVAMFDNKLASFIRHDRRMFYYIGGVKFTPITSIATDGSLNAHQPQQQQQQQQQQPHPQPQ